LTTGLNESYLINIFLKEVFFDRTACAMLLLP
jgi:hypothetical protein